MKKKKKIAFFSLIASTIIINSTSLFNTASTKLVTSYYSVLDESLYDGYAYGDYLVDDSYDIEPYFNYVPQGLCFIEDYVLVSSYEYNACDNSIITILDKDGNLFNRFFLNNNAHVGGLCYDSLHDLVWVSSVNGTVSAYNRNDIFSKVKCGPVYEDIDVGNGLPNYRIPFVNTISYITIDNNSLYVGNFTVNKKGKVKKYTIEEIDGGNIDLKLDSSFRVPDKVQSIAFYNKDDKKYMILSRSFGTKMPSVIQLYPYSENCLDYTESDLYSVIECPTMIEQIAIRDDTLYAVYEANANPYVNSNTKDMDSIQAIDADVLIKKLLLEKDTN